MNEFHVARLNAGRLKKLTLSYGGLFLLLTTRSTKKCKSRNTVAVAFRASIFAWITCRSMLQHLQNAATRRATKYSRQIKSLLQS